MACFQAFQPFSVTFMKSSDIMNSDIIYENVIVYHGSDHILKEPIYQGGKADNDYGNGFYTTEYEDRAILLEGFEVPGITVRTAMEKKLIYHQEGDFYE